MTDAYTPKLSQLKLTEDEVDAIAAALVTSDPWGVDGDLIKSVKNKIRDYQLVRHGHTCCYCRTILHGGGHFMIDREHVLPKGKAIYKKFSYEAWNISVSCKRCNMQFKGEDDNFVVDKSNPDEFKNNQNYLFIHPNFDEWENHLCRESQQCNRQLLVNYTVVGDKGKYTYDYFNLKTLEINSFDQAQGIEVSTEEAASESILEARALALRYGQ